MPTHALVTGASSGIGRAIAQQLGEKGHSLILVGRDDVALKTLADEIEQTSGSLAQVVVADLTTSEGIETICERLRGRDGIEVVVNSAGAGWYGPFVRQDSAEVADLVQLDVLALTMICRAAAESMVASGGGAIMNVASLAAFAPGPFGAIYHAAKAYVASFSEALHEELFDKHVRVSALCPGLTRTKFQARAGARRSGLPKALWSTPDDVARAGLIALEHNEALCVPGRLNSSLAHAARFVPRALLRHASGFTISHLVQAPSAPQGLDDWDNVRKDG